MDLLEYPLLGHPMVPMDPISGTVLGTECTCPNTLCTHGVITYPRCNSYGMLLVHTSWGTME